MSAPTGEPDLADLDGRLAAAAARLREIELTDQRLAEVSRKLAVAADRAARLAARRDEDQRGVEQLEGVSLTRVLAALKGSRGDDLERERAEAAAATYQWREAEAARASLTRDRDALAARVAALPSAQADWAALLAEKEQAVTASTDPRAAELLDNAGRRGALRGELREIDEALLATVAAASALDDVSAKLGSAGSWSTYDTFFGGGTISSAMKHDRLDDAQRSASYAESKLATLRSELADVGADQVVMTLGVTDMTRFVDIWFDNIFTDWMVGDRITKAVESTHRARDAVTKIQERLGDRRRQVEMAVADLERRRVELLAPAGRAQP